MLNNVSVMDLSLNLDIQWDKHKDIWVPNSHSKRRHFDTVNWHKPSTWRYNRIRCSRQDMSRGSHEKRRAQCSCRVHTGYSHTPVWFDHSTCLDSRMDTCKCSLGCSVWLGMCFPMRIGFGRMGLCTRRNRFRYTKSDIYIQMSLYYFSKGLIRLF